MSTKNLTTATFEENAGSGIALIDFWAEWCGPCHKFSPIFESVSEKHPDITFGKVDIDSEPAIAAQFNVQSIPTLMIIRDGVILFQQPGVMPGSAVEELISQARALDMDEVRKHAESHAA